MARTRSGSLQAKNTGRVVREEDWGDSELDRDGLSSQFWSRPEAWPQDTPNQVFLANACLVVGDALHPNEWTGTDPLASLKVSLAERGKGDELTAAQFLRAAQLLKDHKPASYRARPPATDGTLRALERDAGTQVSSRQAPLHKTDLGILRGNRLTQSRFSARQWSLILRQAELEDKHFGAAIARFKDVQEWLVDRQRSGELQSFVRDVQGGEPTALPPSAWNTESWSTRFGLCRFDPDDPYSDQVDPSAPKYLFVRRADLTGLLPPGAKPKYDAAFLANLSPFVHIALQVSGELKLSPSNQPTAAIVQDAIRAAFSASASCAECSPSAPLAQI